MALDYQGNGFLRTLSSSCLSLLPALQAWQVPWLRMRQQERSRRPTTTFIMSDAGIPVPVLPTQVIGREPTSKPGLLVPALSSDWPISVSVDVLLDNRKDTFYHNVSGTVNLTSTLLAPGTHSLRVAAFTEQDSIAFQGLLLDAGATTVATPVPSQLIELWEIRSRQVPLTANERSLIMRG